MTKKRIIVYCDLCARALHTNEQEAEAYCTCENKFCACYTTKQTKGQENVRG